MLARDYIAKMYEDHPELKEKIAEVERIYGDKVEYPTVVIPALLSGMTPAEVAADDTLMDL